MILYYLDRKPEAAAQALTDLHVTEMVHNAAQMLSSAHRILDGNKSEEYRLYDDREQHVLPIYQALEYSSLWARASVENFNWMSEHLIGLLKEFEYRHGRKHHLQKIYFFISTPPYKLRTYHFTNPPFLVNRKYIIGNDVVANYRNYYIKEKADPTLWTKREPPAWLKKKAKI